MKISNFEQKNFLDEVNLFLIWILPIGLIVGSLVVNILILLIISIFLLNRILKKETYIFKNKFLYFLYFIWIYLIFVSTINIENFDTIDQDSIIRSVGFIRYVFLSFAIGYYIKKFSNEKILIFWVLIFLIVTIDLIFEFYNGSNLLGFKSNYHGRLAGFTGEELKIGGLYFGFVLLTISFIFQKKNTLIFPMAILFILVSFLIGERANFVKILFVILIGTFLIDKSNFKKKLIIILISISVGMLAFIIFTNFDEERKIRGRFIVQIFQNTPNSSLIKNLKNSTPHYLHYETSIKIFKDYKIFGIGLKKFRKISHKEKYSKLKNNKYGGGTHPHQLHFEWLVETGIIGYIILFSFFIYYIFIGAKEYMNKKNIYLLSSILFLIASFLPIIPSGSFFTTYTATIFWINFGFLIGNSKIISLK